MKCIYDFETLVIDQKTKGDVTRFYFSDHFLKRSVERKCINPFDIFLLVQKFNNLKIGKRTRILIRNTIFIVERTTFNTGVFITAYKATEQQIKKINNVF